MRVRLSLASSWAAVTSRSRGSWTSWRQRQTERRLQATRRRLVLLAKQEARLLLAQQVQGLTLQARALRLQELLADLQTPEQQPRPPELPSQEAPEPQPPVLPVMHRPQELEEPPPPPATDQLRALLSSTAPLSSTSSAP